MNETLPIKSALVVLESKWLKPDEVRKSLRIGRASMNDLLASGRLKATRVGRTWRIPAEALAAL